MDTDAQPPKTGAPADHSVGYADAAPAQKYIRTFAGDMEVAQKGGTPDLVPLTEHPKPAEETPVTSRPVLIPKPEKPKQAVWDEKAREDALARVRAKIAEDEAHSVHRSTEQPEPLIERAEDILADSPSPLHTYSEDFSDRIKEQHASTATVLAAEQDATATGGASAPQESRSGKTFVIAGGVLLLALSGGGIYYAYTIYAQDNRPVVVAPAILAPIFVNEQQQVAGEGGLLLQSMQGALAQPLAPGMTRLLSSPSATTTRKSLFVALSFSVPNILIRNIQGAESMAGVINVSGVQSLFFILSVGSYNETFAGMLQWEPKMEKDLAAFFPPYPVQAIVPTSVATTTTSTTTKKASTQVSKSAPVATITPVTPLYIPTFRDEVVANHDARVLRDGGGRSLVIYGYWNQTTLIIARDTAAFAELIGRLANSRTQP